MSEITNEEQPTQPIQPLGNPEIGPKEPRTPDLAGEPVDPRGKGPEPAYFPGEPGGDLRRLRQSLHVRRTVGRQRAGSVSWLQAH